MKKLAPAAAIIWSVCVASILSFKGSFFLNMSPSLPLGLWLKSDALVEEGTYIAFCPTKQQVGKRREKGLCPKSYMPFLKQVSKIKGDKLFVVGHHPKSLDSKTFGYIDRSQIITVVTPAFTL